MYNINTKYNNIVSKSYPSVFKWFHQKVGDGGAV